MKHLTSLSLIIVLALLMPSLTKAQVQNEQVKQYLIQVDKIGSDNLKYKVLDSLHQLKGLSLKNLAEIKFRLASTAMNLKKNDTALRLCHEGIDIAAKNNFDTLHVSFYKVIGSINYYTGKLPDAIQYFKNAALLAKQKQILYLEVTNYGNAGAVSIDNKQLDTAEKYLNITIQLSKNCGEKCTKPRLTALRLLATLYELQKQFSKAEKLYQDVEAEAAKEKDTIVVCSVLTFYSNLLFLMDKKQLALEKAQKSVDLLKAFKGSYDMSSMYFAISVLAKRQMALGLYKEAAELRSEAMELQQKLFAKENQQHVNELETQFKVKEIEQEKDLAKANALAEKQQKQLLYLLLFGIALIAALLIIIIQFRNKRKQINEKINAQKELVKSILETEEKERSQIAKDLHDGIVQDLTAIKFELKSITQEAPEQLKSQLNKLLSSVDVTSKEVREISYQMMPVTLRELGLLKAINELLNRSLTKNNIEFEFDSFGIEERLAEKIETTVYRICQELINNTIKHSQATQVSILLQLRNNFLQLTYEDNGIGFDASTIKKGIGLNSLSSRIEMVKGSLEIEGSNNAGTTAYIRIPL